MSTIMLHRCFNPRTHVGCDIASSYANGENPSFNPRTHVGCDRRVGRGRVPCRSFNPRTHVGCDENVGVDGQRKSVFQSTHPRRVRLSPFTAAGVDFVFQSTHPRRVRPLQVRYGVNQMCFNPRTHVGCDFLKFGIIVVLACFNPRTHVGCDQVKTR